MGWTLCIALSALNCAIFVAWPEGKYAPLSAAGGVFAGLMGLALAARS